jgi:8-oxo-dGTP pyrophosphatase MutT (NUDIX family)
MWIVSSIGFFSVVRKSDDIKFGTLTIRARVKTDLEKLRELYLPGMGEISENAGTDYRYCAKAPRGEIGLALANMALDLDYSNFKNEVAKRQGKSRAGSYGKVWDVLYGLSDTEAQPAPSKITAQPGDKTIKGKARAFGGVLLDRQRRVLLREPANHYDGYVWTFPKGRPDHGETPEHAALREVREETGYSAKIVAKLPGEYAGGTTVTEYFLMEAVGQQAQVDKETASVRWAHFDEAKALIQRSTNKSGRERDLAVLRAAGSWLDETRAHGAGC